MLDSLHDYVVFAVAALCLLGVIHPRVPTGVLGTAGLGAAIVGLLYSLDDAHDPWLALDILTGGIGTIGVCLGWRVVRRPKRAAMRRADDWTPGVS